MTSEIAAIGAGFEMGLGSSADQLSTLRRTIDQVVGSVFYGTLLKTMHSSVLKGEFGHGGRGEEVFQAQLDQILAERSGRAGSFELNQVLFERFAKAAKAGASPQGGAQPNRAGAG